MGAGSDVAGVRLALALALRATSSLASFQRAALVILLDVSSNGTVNVGVLTGGA